MIIKSPLRPLHTTAVRRLWAGQAVALFGAELHLVVIAWLALEITGSGLALGTVLVAGVLPRTVFTLLGGVLADRMGHRPVLLSCNLLRAVVVMALAIVVAGGHLRLWHLYIVGTVLGTLTSFYAPALFSAIPRECRQGDVRAANALIRGTAEAVGVVGPVLGGFIVAVAGTVPAVWMTGACYLLSALPLTMLQRAPRTHPGFTEGAPKQRKSVLSDMAGSFAVVARDRFLRRVLLFISIAGLTLTGPITVGVPWMARETFGSTAIGFGLLLSMWTAGTLVGVTASGSLSRTPRWRVLVTTVCLVLGVCMVALGLADNLTTAAVCLFGMGTAAGSFNIFLMTWLQQRAPTAMIGRVMSIAEFAEIISTPVSFLLAGALLDVSVAWLFGGAGLLLAVASLVVVLSRDVPDSEPRTTETRAHGGGG